ncbi:Homoaconitase [Paramyrothecium foliicola]|nr:Homoaconitase [Paramyrothecium foliicola]
MSALRRGVALNAVALARFQSRTLSARSRSLPVATAQFRAYTATSPRRQAFTSQLHNTPDVFDQPFQTAAAPAVPQNLTEKIAQKYAVGLAPGKVVKAGDYISLAPHRVMTHDNTAAVLTKYNETGAKKGSFPAFVVLLHDPSMLVFAFDHDVQSTTEANLKKQARIAKFAGEHGIIAYPAGRGIGHQIMVEEGHAWPGTVTVASDSHSNTYGAVGALGTPIVRTDAASLWITGRTWWQIPPVAKIPKTLTGILPPGVTGKDVILALCGLFNKDEVLSHAIEFAGSEETMASIPIDDRLTIANMTTEWGALSGVFPVDEMLISWYRAKATVAALSDSPLKDRLNHKRVDELAENRLVADPGASYAKEYYINLSTLSPFVSGPNTPKVTTPLKTLEPKNIAINKAYLISCTNARSSDIAAAARVFREAAEREGKPVKVAPGVDFYISAASLPEQEMAEETGDWQVLVDAGAHRLPSGCGPCIGLGRGLLQDGDVCVSASNRNFPGRMGARDAQAYLASPEIVAASALQGKIAGPGWYQKPEGVEKVIIGEGSGDYTVDKARSVTDAFDKMLGDIDSMIAAAEGGEGQSSSPAAGDEALTEILPGFPEKIEGEIVFLDQDSINTDSIYPGKYTYEELATEDMARVCMENYDTEFGTTAKPGDILVGGFAFGTGSSREQAATAILAKQIPLVVSGSFNNIFSRNSINNALPGLEVPKLVERLREAFKDAGKIPTRRTGWKLLWDVRRSKVVVTEKDGSVWEQKVGELPPNVQEIIAVGGLEKWVKSKIQA